MIRGANLLLLTACFLTLYSCKKGATNNPVPTKATAIIGKWLFSKDHIRIYSPTGNIVIDTTNAFGIFTPGVNLYQTFDKDGNSLEIDNSDTTAIHTYTISGNALYTWDDPSHIEYEVQNILVLNGTNMELEAVLIGSDQSPSWKLDPTVTYKYVEDRYYTKQ